MNRHTLFRRSLITAAVAAMAACTSPIETPVEPVKPGTHAGVLPGTHAVETPSQVISNYQWYQNVLEALKRNDDTQPAQFLAQQAPSAMSNTVRNQWLKNLGKRGNWALFGQQYTQLNADERDQETRCYAAVGGIEPNPALAAELIQSLTRLPEGCNAYLNQMAAAGQLDTDAAWRRVRGLLSNNQISDARALAAALGSPLPNPLSSAGGGSPGQQEALLYSVTSRDGRRSADVATRIQALSGSLTSAQTGFAWALAAHNQALNQNMDTALAYFNRADRKQFSTEHWEWYARAALRGQRWNDLAGIIRAMPSSLQNDPTWQYWLGRSLAAQGQRNQAEALYRQAAASGRNFYALMATEALGGKVDTRNNVADSSRSDVQRVAQDGNIARALALFQAAQNSGDWTMRRQAQAEWRYAIKNYNEATLLASSTLANEQGFYEMGILSADRTNQQLNYNLRYISPFRDVTERYAAQANVDPAWVYGLIRQESRFMLGVRSRVGATGLMQVMPATAEEIARKIGMSSAELHTMDGNIRMGTWYLGDARNRMGDEIMATAGYNAGASRARRWQAAVPLEGAIYAETIPFDETRTYVKNVMANATYYASVFNEPQTSLTRRMGTVPAR